MATELACRRRHSRIGPPDGVDAWVEFRYPEPGGHPCSMRLRDLSQSGISFELKETLPGFEIGDILRGFTMRIARSAVRGEFLLMHATPGNSPGAVCGGLFYPATEKDLLQFRDWLETFSEDRR